MEPEIRDQELEELVLRLIRAGVRPGAELLLRILEDYSDMKRHLGVVREAARAIGEVDNSVTEAQ